jgi:hypothetical protein
MKDIAKLTGVIALLLLFLAAVIGGIAWEVGKTIAVWQFIFG